MVVSIITIVLVLAMVFTYDWLLYKNRGRAQPDSPEDSNPQVIRTEEDAIANRIIDLSKNRERKDAETPRRKEK
jgi:hypothetical protein